MTEKNTHPARSTADQPKNQFEQAQVPIFPFRRRRPCRVRSTDDELVYLGGTADLPDGEFRVPDLSRRVHFGQAALRVLPAVRGTDPGRRNGPAQHADRHGRVVETGDHATLTRGTGLYAELFALQAEAYS
jgi:hypothetical protein